ncbi:MAG: ATP-grasp domain-containing protein [Bacillota bacterium]|nr:ATP-grasp domain-containing protein [Bacillota bacterium]
MTETFDLIDLLNVNRDKGRIIWLCNIGAEKYWNKVNAGISDSSEDIIVNHIEEMNLLLCRRQDIMLLREPPAPEYLEMLELLGFSIPEILTPENPDPSVPISELVLKDDVLISKLREISGSDSQVFFVPYAVTTVEEQIAEKARLKLTGSSSAVNAKINDKIFNRQISETLGLPVCEGKVCLSIEEIRDEYRRLSEDCGFKRVIIKEPYGASGKGLYIVDSQTKLEPVLRIISRFSRNDPNAKWLVEGWYEKKADINYQIYVSPSGKVTVFSIKQQLLNDTVYIGSKLPPDLSEDEITQYQNYGRIIGEYLYSIGYSGVAGIDSIITKDSTIIPIIEINGRFTLSTYISFLKQVIGDKTVLTRYFRLASRLRIGFDEFYSILEDNDLDFKPDKKEGVIVYTSATLPVHANREGTSFLGRIFTLVVAEGMSGIEYYNNRLEKLIEAI